MYKGDCKMGKNEKNVVKIGEYSYCNCTPHDVHLILEDETVTIPKNEDKLIRLEERRYLTVNHGNVKVNVKTFLDAENMPDQKEFNYYIVSDMVLRAFPKREDLISPDEIVRNENGHIIGCKSFYRR
jgi:hypothetical protein